MKIGIIGYGYVGSAVAASYPDDKILISDPKYPHISKSIEDLKSKCRAIFVCVPTPSDESGACDTGILESVLKQLQGFTGMVISKSTAPPQTYQRLEAILDVNLAHVPEFLTQARAKHDYVNPHKIVVGCRKKHRSEVTDILMNSAVNFDRVSIEYCSVAEASFFKYLANNMLAIKVAVCNEFYDLAKVMDVNWQSIVDIAKNDHRLGSTHWSVPGPDGSRGFGGACFPKDTQAINHMSNKLKVGMPVLSTTIKSNKKRR